MKIKKTYITPHICFIYIDERYSVLASLSGDVNDDVRLPDGGDDNTGRAGDAKGYESSDGSLWDDTYQ